MTRVDTPQTLCRAAFARADITPPVGIYHRMWGAATHERATGIHRPLTATALCLESTTGEGRQLILGLDHCLLEEREVAHIRIAVTKAVSIAPEAVQVALSHTHGAGWMSRDRGGYPGGELIGPYLDQVAEICADLAKTSTESLQPATMIYGTARCNLAAHRDYLDVERDIFVCGFNPEGPADDTVMLAKVVAENGETLGTVVNYACHPTTLAWQNTLISPDYVGAMRDVIEERTSGPCLFLQGASGDLGPREGFVGDPRIADRNGRQLGYAVLSGLQALPAPHTTFTYTGPVVSGATLGTWEYQPFSQEVKARCSAWQSQALTISLKYRDDLPTLAETREELAKWEAAEVEATEAGDAERARDCHAKVEQMQRQIRRLVALPEGEYPLAVWVARLGGSLWVFTPGELYQSFQTTLRSQLPDAAVMVSTISNGWQPGYLPPTSAYGRGIYQEIIATVAPGSLEAVTERVTQELQRLWSD